MTSCEHKKSVRRMYCCLLQIQTKSKQNRNGEEEKMDNSIAANVIKNGASF